MTRTMALMACPACGEETEVDISDLVLVAGTSRPAFCTICATSWKITMEFYEIEGDDDTSNAVP